MFHRIPIESVEYIRSDQKVYYFLLSLLQTEVIKVEKGDNFEETGQWVVTTRALETNKASKGKYDFVMVANGHLTEPNRPHLQGLNTFKGKVLHTHDFKVGISLQ